MNLVGISLLLLQALDIECLFISGLAWFHGFSRTQIEFLRVSKENKSFVLVNMPK